jgi:maleate isomerase
MAFSSWRGIVGLVHPTLRPGSTEEFCRLCPEGIGVLPLFNNIRRGTREEFQEVMAGYESNVALLAEQGCDVIHPGGAPPFMVLGVDGERKLIDKWEKKYKVPMFTSGQNHIAALKALKVKSIVGASYFPGELNKTFARYFEDGGFKVRSLEGMDVEFNKVQELAGEQVYAYIKRQYLSTKGADAIYMLGSGWRTLNIIEMLEKDLDVPVVHPMPARVWEVQKRLHINEPRTGYGTLLAKLPKLPH